MSDDTKAFSGMFDSMQSSIDQRAAEKEKLKLKDLSQPKPSDEKELQRNSRILTHHLKTFASSLYRSRRFGIDTLSEEHLQRSKEFTEHWNAIVDYSCMKMFKGNSVPEYTRASIRNASLEVASLSFDSKTDAQQVVEDVFNNDYMPMRMDELMVQHFTEGVDSDVINAGVSIQKIKNAIREVLSSPSFSEESKCCLFGKPSAKDDIDRSSKIAAKMYLEAQKGALVLIDKINLLKTEVEPIQFGANKNSYISMHVGNIVSEIKYNHSALFGFARDQYNQVKDSPTDLEKLLKDGVAINWIENKNNEFQDLVVDSYHVALDFTQRHEKSLDDRRVVDIPDIKKAFEPVSIESAKAVAPEPELLFGDSENKFGVVSNVPSFNDPENHSIVSVTHKSLLSAVGPEALDKAASKLYQENYLDVEPEKLLEVIKGVAPIIKQSELESDDSLSPE